MELLLFCLTLFLGFFAVIFTIRLGKEYTIAMFAGLGVLMAFMITHPLEIFGWSILLAEAFYAAFFLGTDIITDHFGKKEAKRIVYAMLSGFAGTILFGKLIIFLMNGSDLSNALESFFGPLTLWSLALVTLIMFFEQRLDIFLFSKIKAWTGEKKLWLRNCLSTITTQTFDVVIAYPIFLYPVFGAEIWKLMLAAVIIKILMSLIDTPLVYLSRKLLTKTA